MALKMIQENIGSVLDRMTDEYIQNLSENGSVRKPNIKNLIRTYRPTKKDLRALCDDYTEFLNEIDGAITGNDDDMVEAWDFLSKTKLNHLRDFVVLIQEFLDENSKIKRKKRKINKSVRVKNMKYREKCEGASSINPENIIGMHYFVCYNCKQKKIFFYESDEGFDVKGTTIQNFNVNRSFSKSFGRSKLTPKSVQDMGILAIRNEIEKMSAKKLKATGRVNADIILLKVG